MMVPSFEEVLDKLKIEGIRKEQWAELWDESQACFSMDAEFLQKDFFIEQNQVLHLIDEVMELILSAVERVQKDEILARFLFHMNYVIFKKQYKPGDTLAVWPDLKNVLGDLRGGFDAMVYISGIDLIKEKFKAHGISRATLEHTLYDLMEKFYRYHKTYGIWYVDCQDWMCRIFKGVFVNIGRLQFEFKNNYSFKVFKHKENGNTIAFFPGEQTVRRDGLIDGTNQVTDPNAFKTVYSEDEYTVTGNPVIPTGYISDKVITLKKEEYRLCLDIGDTVLNIHIPGSRGRMPVEECAYALKTAISFYKEHFPEEKPKAFYCSSWLLGNGLEMLLKEDSNIIRFQREFYLGPVKSDERGTNFFIFGKYDISDITPKTTLEKNLFEFMEKGIYMHNGIGFILFEDIHRYGEQYYRNTFVQL